MVLQRPFGAYGALYMLFSGERAKGLLLWSLKDLKILPKNI